MMEQVLFVDACMRGDVSRTRTLCQAFLAQYTALRPQCQVLHRDLTGASLPVLTGPLTQQRDQWVREGEDSPLLAPAREVAGADLILIGAPYWDLTFPAALKVYLEWASTLGLTFAYTPEGEQVGLSRARHLVFVTTAGGPIGTLNLGYDYLKAWGAWWASPAPTASRQNSWTFWGRMWRPFWPKRNSKPHPWPPVWPKNVK